MKNILKVIAIAAGVLTITACVEDEVSNNGYYSSGSGTTRVYDESTVGYNRNYQPRKPVQPGNNGYSSGGAGSVRNSTQQSSGYYSSSSGMNGYSSSGRG